MLGEETGLIVESAVITVIEDMEEEEVILEEVVFKVGLVIILDKMVIEIERIEGHGDSLGQEKVEQELGQNQVLDQVSTTSTNRDRVRCFKCREYDHFVNECPNLVPEDSDRESDGARSAS